MTVKISAECDHSEGENDGETHFIFVFIFWKI